MRELKVTWIVRESEAAPAPCESASDAYAHCRDLREELQEVFRVLFLDSKGRIFGMQDVTRGTLTASLVHPRELFRAAILANAASIVVAHNHPSGDSKPSPEDYAVTRKLKAAGEILGIPLRDHLVIGASGYESCL